MEHLQHFGLGQDPFSNEPDLRFYFESASHLDAQRRVERGLRQHKGLTVLTGEGGMGKTLLARRILESLEEELFEATLLVMLPGAADATGILQRFARQLGAEEPAADRAGLLGQLYEQLAIVREDGRHAVLMIDDAQIMTPDVFAELGGLLNLEYEDRRLVSMLFIGSPELDALVQNDPSMAPRIDVRVQLHPLSSENASAYVAHRIAAVKGNAGLISSGALETLFKLGRGRPRLINTLADNALFEAYLAGRRELEPGDVERAAQDLGIGPDPGTTFSPSISGAGASASRLAAVPPQSAASAERRPAPKAPMLDLEMEATAAESLIEADLQDGSGEGLELELTSVLPDEAEEPTIEASFEAVGFEAGSESNALDLEETFETAMAELRDPAREPESAPGVVESAEWAFDDLDLEEEAVLEVGEPLSAESADAAFEPRRPELELPEARLEPAAVADIDELDDVFVELIEE